MNFQSLNKQRKFIFFLSVIGFISMFLPWASISLFGSTESVNGMHNKGIIVFFCFLVAGIISLKDNQQNKLEQTMWMLTLFAGVIALIFTFWFYTEASGSILGSSVVGAGNYLAVIAAIGIILSAYLVKAPENNLRDGFNSLKASFQHKLGSSSNELQDTAASPTNSHEPLSNASEPESVTSIY
ncbi:MAG: hypothetical protein ABI359_04995 [Ginsengibacter sp.]